MSRRRAAIKRQILPDAKYGSILVAKFMNCLMKDGKKTCAERAVYNALDKTAQVLGVSPVEALEAIVANVRPLIEVRSKRVGGATYQVPCDVRPTRALALALRWLINAARSRKDKKTIDDRLAAEFLDAHAGRGEAVKKRENTHKMADANKAFAHYNW
ncbi:MAG: rpsG [Candidatus Midichloriaceae bacterium]|jgi:small subunit ribosomal protein S7|nr:rpsG [Candidatus Midichloriaceae bacterium]